MRNEPNEQNRLHGCTRDILPLHEPEYCNLWSQSIRVGCLPILQQGRWTIQSCNYIIGETDSNVVCTE